MNQHIDPEEAVKVHIDVKARKSLAIHWGTFALAVEVSWGVFSKPMIEGALIV